MRRQRLVQAAPPSGGIGSGNESCLSCQQRGRVLYQHYMTFEAVDDLVQHLRKLVPQFPTPDHGYNYEQWIQSVAEWYHGYKPHRKQIAFMARKAEESKISAWNRQFGELISRRMATPENVERLAQEHFGGVPEYVAMTLRMWRKALASETSGADTVIEGF